MSNHDNRAIHQRVISERMNRHDLELIDELIHPDYVNHDMPSPIPG